MLTRTAVTRLGMVLTAGGIGALAGIWIVQSILVETGTMPNGLGPLADATGGLRFVVGAIGLGFLLLAVAPTAGFASRLARAAYGVLGFGIIALQIALSRSSQPGVVGSEDWSGLVIYGSVPVIGVGIALLVVAAVLQRRAAA